MLQTRAQSPLIRHDGDMCVVVPCALLWHGIIGTAGGVVPGHYCRKRSRDARQNTPVGCVCCAQPKTFVN